MYVVMKLGKPVATAKSLPAAQRWANRRYPVKSPYLRGFWKAVSGNMQRFMEKPGGTRTFAGVEIVNVEQVASVEDI